MCKVGISFDASNTVAEPGHVSILLVDCMYEGGQGWVVEINDSVAEDVCNVS